MPFNQQTTLPARPVIPFIVQARSSSSRYAQKVLRNFADNQSLLEFQLMRLQKAFPSSPIVVATTTSEADQFIENIAKKNGIACFRGDEHDVLDRFLTCCTHFNFTDYIVRVCSDNPFLQTGLLHNLIQTALEKHPGSDYISYSINRQPAILTHFGFFAEMVKVDALRRVGKETSDRTYREHVTNYIYRGPGESFKISWIPLEELSGHLDVIRLTIDSKDDFDNAQFVYKEWMALKEREDISWADIISIVDDNVMLKERMKAQIKLYQK